MCRSRHGGCSCGARYAAAAAEPPGAPPHQHPVSSANTGAPPFRLAPGLLLVTMLGLAACANMPMGAVAVLGGPVLFLLYMWPDRRLTFPAAHW